MPTEFSLQRHLSTPITIYPLLLSGASSPLSQIINNGLQSLAVFGKAVFHAYGLCVKHGSFNELITPRYHEFSGA